MWFEKTDYIVLRPDSNGLWDFIAFATKEAAGAFLAINPEAVLVRFNVRAVGNNMSCETYAEAENTLAEEKKKNLQALISMMAPSRKLPSGAQTMYYDATKQFS